MGAGSKFDGGLAAQSGPALSYETSAQITWTVYVPTSTPPLAAGVPTMAAMASITQVVRRGGLRTWRARVLSPGRCRMAIAFLGIGSIVGKIS